MIFSHNVFCDWYPPVEIMVYNIHVMCTKILVLCFIICTVILYWVQYLKMKTLKIKCPSYPTCLGASA